MNEKISLNSKESVLIASYLLSFFKTRIFNKKDIEYITKNVIEPLSSNKKFINITDEIFNELKFLLDVDGDAASFYDFFKDKEIFFSIEKKCNLYDKRFNN